MSVAIAGIIAGAAAVVGGAFSAHGIMAAADAKSDAENREADLKERQAKEILDREILNREIVEREGEFEAQGAIAAAAASGTYGGSGAYLKAHQKISLYLMQKQREAQFNADMLREGAQSNRLLAGDIQASKYWQAAGTILSAGHSAYQDYGQATRAPEQLPQTSSQANQGVG